MTKCKALTESAVKGLNRFGGVQKQSHFHYKSLILAVIYCNDVNWNRCSELCSQYNYAEWRPWKSDSTTKWFMCTQYVHERVSVVAGRPSHNVDHHFDRYRFIWRLHHRSGLASRTQTLLSDRHLIFCLVTYHKNCILCWHAVTDIPCQLWAFFKWSCDFIRTV